MWRQREALSVKLRPRAEQFFACRYFIGSAAVTGTFLTFVRDAMKRQQISGFKRRLAICSILYALYSIMPDLPAGCNRHAQAPPSPHQHPTPTRALLPLHRNLPTRLWQRHSSSNAHQYGQLQHDHPLSLPPSKVHPNHPIRTLHIPLHIIKFRLIRRPNLKRLVRLTQRVHPKHHSSKPLMDRPKHIMALTPALVLPEL